MRALTISKYVGRSTEKKPTLRKGDRGVIFYEEDTAKEFVWSGVGWNEFGGDGTILLGATEELFIVNSSDMILDPVLHAEVKPGFYTFIIQPIFLGDATPDLQYTVEVPPNSEGQWINNVSNAGADSLEFGQIITSINLYLTNKRVVWVSGTLLVTEPGIVGLSWGPMTSSTNATKRLVGSTMTITKPVV